MSSDGTNETAAAETKGTAGDEQGDRLRLVLITGLSGSGKSTVAKSFEDLGFHVVDNLPLALLRLFLQQPRALVADGGKIALVTDLRTPGVAEELPRLLPGLDRESVNLTVLFLETSEAVLVRRFSETRRRHPLAQEGRVLDGIRRERELLTELRGAADLVLDTSDWTVHDVRAEIYREFGEQGDTGSPLTVSLVSFGFKHGAPYGADLQFDVRYLPNPHFVTGLRELTGRDAPVRDYLEEQAAFGELADRLLDLLTYLLPRFAAENRSYLTIGIGCTGGKHRSVAMVEKLQAALAEQQLVVHAVHRDIAK